MKKIILTFILGLFAFTMNAQDQAASKAEIKFEKNAHNFGQIEKGGDGTYEFKFKNEGTEPLVLSSVRASCGCTTPSWTREPIAPGAEGSIKVKYDTNRMGAFNKTITVQSNASNQSTIILKINGEVKSTPEKPSTPTKQGGSVIAK
ncbi:MAG: hypothetical protein RL754_1176 [Bacteroidota bacterium]|jgi:hypothetical protein